MSLLETNSTAILQLNRGHFTCYRSVRLRTHVKRSNSPMGINVIIFNVNNVQGEAFFEFFKILLIILIVIFKVLKINCLSLSLSLSLYIYIYIYIYIYV